MWAEATVWTRVDGFGKRRRSTIRLEGITINMPLIIEIVDEQSKLEPLLSQIKRMVGDNGLIILQNIDAHLALGSYVTYLMRYSTLMVAILTAEYNKAICRF